MKRILPIIFILLLLTGCADGGVQETMPTEPAVTEPPVELVSLYDADSQTEQQTGGAVRVYPLGDGASSELLMMGDKLLVAFDDGILTALQGELCQITATGIASFAQDRNDGELTVWDNGLLYFDRQTREAVLLDTQLRESLRVALPAESQGTPLLQSNGDIFYCTDTEIRALNIYTGVSRLVRQHNYAAQVLTGSYFDDTIIGCRVTVEEGVEHTLYLNAETGALVHTDTAGYRMQTAGDRYFATGQTEENAYIFGSMDTEPMCLHPETEAVASVLAANGAVGYTVTDTGLELRYYDLNTGLCTACVTLEGVGAPHSFASNGGSIWLTAGNVLYCWDTSASQLAEEAVYTEQLYTAENPDQVGLTECQSRVQQLYETYGLSLYIWQEAANNTKDYTLEEEYRVSVIHDALEQIENLLQQFPEGFIPTTGNVSFHLVGALKNGEPYAQYWDGSTCNVVLDGTDVTRSFLLGLGVAMDTRVLGNSRDFDTWDELNPSGFRYTYDYESNLQREDWEDYLDAFIDLDSMSFPTEDRSRIFAYALLAEGEEYFTHDDLQDKLLRICQAIREAYDLEDSTQILPWEQYLDEPLAKTE